MSRAGSVSRDVVCVGILVADVVARPIDGLPSTGSLGLVDEVALRTGGCATNTATALTRLGARAAVMGKVGRDALGDYLLGELAERGVAHEGVLRDDDAPTSATVVLVSPDGERTFLHMRGANAELRAEDLDPALLFSGRCLHVAGALVLDALDGEPCAALLAQARAKGILTSVDTVWDASGRWERILPSLVHTDVFMPSLAEAKAISGEPDAASAAEWLRRAGAREVVVKLGADGCYVGGSGHVAGLEVAAVDSTGAGDAFAAGLLFGLLAGWPIERAARLANAAGALATTAVGASTGVRALAETRALAGL
jgi:sugar/nucleoside kinase (ribokinase family)